MVVPEPGSRPATEKPAAREAFDLLRHIVAFLGSPPPLTLVITGASGTGKSILLRTLLPALQGTGLFIAYRTEVRETVADEARSGGLPSLSLLMVDPGATGAEGSVSAPGPALRTPETAPSTPPSVETIPPLLAAAAARLATQGGGFVAIDSWDATSEQEFRSRATVPTAVHALTAPTTFLRSQFGRLPVREILAMSSVPDPAFLSGADGVIDLGWEDVEGFRLRVVSLPKLRSTPAPETRFLYTLDGGEFHCPPQFLPGFRPPIGPPNPDPEPQEASLFPGSVPFATAFGRLRFHGLTGLEVPPRFPSLLADVFLYPLVAHTLSIGGRVAWIPSASSGPGQITSQLSRFIPPDFLRERLRVLSPGGPDQGMGELGVVALPVRRESSEVREARPASAPGVPPMFPDAYHFLKATPEGRPSLYVIYLDGLNALATIAGVTVNAETFPLVVGGYLRLPRFHGFGFGRADDPLDKVLASTVDTYVRVVERYGRTVLFGVRPRTSPYILDWAGDSGRYALVPVK